MPGTLHHFGRRHRVIEIIYFSLNLIIYFRFVLLTTTMQTTTSQYQQKPRSTFRRNFWLCKQNKANASSMRKLNQCNGNYLWRNMKLDRNEKHFCLSTSTLDITSTSTLGGSQRVVNAWKWWMIRYQQSIIENILYAHLICISLRSKL